MPIALIFSFQKLLYCTSLATSVQPVRHFEILQARRGQAAKPTSLVPMTCHSNMSAEPKKFDKNLFRILAFGDSLTTGNIGGELHEAFDKPYTIGLLNLVRENHAGTSFEVDNMGIYGELVCGEMSERLPKVLKECGPYDLVIILGGTNDIIEPKQGLEDTLFDGIKRLHAEVKGQGAKCIALTIPETDIHFKDLLKNGLSWVKEEGENIRLLVNDKLRRSVKGHNDKIILCDLAEKFPQHSLSGEDLDKLWSDGLHFTEEGYNKMAEIIYEDMKHLLPSRKS